MATSRKTKVAQAAAAATGTDGIKIGETIYTVNGKQATMAEMLEAINIKHPWLGLLAQIGTIAIGFSASVVIASVVANFIAAGTTSMFVVGIALALYYFIGFCGCILSFRAASVVGDYVANGKVEQHYQDAKAWVKGLFSSKDEVVGATIH